MKIRQLITLSVVAAFSLAMVMPETAGSWMLAALVILSLLTTVLRDFQTTHLSVFALFWTAGTLFVPYSRFWPFNLLMPLAAYAAIVGLIPQLRHSVGWLRKGGFGADARMMVAFTVVVSSLALVAWTALAKPDLSEHLSRFPDMPFWLYPFAGLGFACLNAAMEEIVFRGLMTKALDDALGAGIWPVVAQSVSFAAFHYLAGFPFGAWGFVMTMAYGIMLGMVRRKSGGLFAPWIAHVVADSVIFAVLAIMRNTEGFHVV